MQKEIDTLNAKAESLAISDHAYLSHKYVGGSALKVNRGAFTSSKKDRRETERMPDHLFDMSVQAESKKAIY
jgi:hypothetical protein